MDDLQQAKKFLKMVAKSQTKAERQRIKDRAEDKRRQAIVDKERANCVNRSRKPPNSPNEPMFMLVT